MHSSLFSMDGKLARSVLGLAALACFALVSGCEVNDFVNPGEEKILGRDTMDKPPLVVPILDVLAPGVETNETPYASATDVQAEDLVPEITDYRIGKNDQVTVSIMDLNGEGTGESLRSLRVSETGYINPPLIPPVKGEGLTEQELKDAVVKAYQDAKLIRQPQVSVTVTVALNRTFTIQGNAGAPGQFAISQPDYRLLDALVAGKAPAATTGVDTIYIIRRVKNSQTSGKNGSATQPASAPVDLLAPQGRANSQNSLSLLMDVQAQPAPSNDLLAPGAPERSTGIIEGQAAPGAMALPATRQSGTFAFNAPQEPTDVRVIKVPVTRLLQQGELRYNIVVRPGDMIVVPSPTIGVYYMDGHVKGTGAYSLSGTQVTLKGAWAAAHGADDFAVPGRSEVIRRLGKKEVFVRIDYSKILAGEQSDIFLKPDDEVIVGTDFLAPFLAAIRNSFRLTYGFGFLYDRNFNTQNNGN